MAVWMMARPTRVLVNFSVANMKKSGVISAW